MKQFVSIFLVTSVAFLIGLSLKKGDYLKTLYQEFMTPQKWRRVEIVDEKSMFEELLRDYIWEYLEVLVVGLTACIFTFTIGWSAANSMCKVSADSVDEDIPEECLEENCDLNGRLEEVEEITTELERSGHRLSTRKASNIELKLSEGETMNEACRSDYNGSRQEIEEDTTSLNCLTIEKVNGEPATLKDAKIKSETCDKLITTEIYNTSGLAYLTRDKSNIYYPKNVETDDLFDESTNPHDRDCHELSKEDRVFTYRKVKISQFLPKKVTAVDALGSCKSRNEKSIHVGGQVQELVVESNLNKSRTSRTDTLESSRNEHGDSNLNLFGCTKTGRSLEERTINKSEVNRNINKFGDTNLEMDSNNSKNFSTKIIEGRVEVERFSKLDVSPSSLTVAVDGVGPGRDSARSARWRGSSHKIDCRGRTPHYQNLNREIKPDPKTTKLNKKDNRTARTPTSPHQYIDELSKDVLSTHQSDSERPGSSTGDNLHAKGSQRRKKNQKYHALNSSNKTDSKNC